MADGNSELLTLRIVTASGEVLFDRLILYPDMAKTFRKACQCADEHYQREWQRHIAAETNNPERQR